jgi:hypothetical protein
VDRGWRFNAARTAFERFFDCARGFRFRWPTS